MIDKKKIGSPTGPRPVIWHGVAIKDNMLYSRKISSEDSFIKGDEFYKEHAIKVFVSKYGMDPLIMEGPFRNAHLSPKKIISDDKFDRDSMVFTGETRNISYKGWSGIAHLVKDEKDNEAAIFLFESELNPTLGKSKAEPKAKLVPISILGV